MKPVRVLSACLAAAVVFAGCTEAPTGAVAPDDASLSAAASRGGPAGRTAQAEGGQYVIMLRGNSVPADLEARVRAAGGSIVRTIPEIGIVVATSSSPGFARALRTDGRVQAVAEDLSFALPNVTRRVERPAEGLDSGPTPADLLFNLGLLWGIERVNAPAAWAAGHTGSHNTVVAIFDTGIASNHPDLGPNLVFDACFSSEGDHVGDWEPGAPCNPYPSLDWHGTHVAGTVGAAFGGGFAVGVAPNIGLANYNIFEWIPGCGVCTFSSVRWAAMIDAANRGFDVINMSLGALYVRGPGADNAAISAIRNVETRVQNYVTQAGTTLISSSGNAGINLNGPLFTLPSAAPGTMDVGATGIRPNPWYEPGISYDVRAFYSNYGATVDVVAPGGDCGVDDHCEFGLPPNWVEHLILSTDVWPDPNCAMTRSCDVWYSWAAGTSMAAPHVSGVAGLVRDANPRLNPQQVVSTIRRTAERIGSRQHFGHGMVDAAAATGVN